MRLYRRVLGWDVELSNGARWGWGHLKLHKSRDGHYRNAKLNGLHLVWGKLSLNVNQHYLIEYTVCADCYGEIRSNGDVDYCDECHQIEGETITATEEKLEEMGAM